MLFHKLVISFCCELTKRSIAFFTCILKCFEYPWQNTWLRCIKGHNNGCLHCITEQTVEADNMPRLTEQQRHNAIGRLQGGQTQLQVANALRVSRQTISNLWRRYNGTGTVRDRPRSGRPRVTTHAQDRFIRLRHLRDRFTTATSTSTQIPGLRRISGQTVRNRLRAAGIFARRPVRRNVLTPRHVQERLQWCRQRATWPQARLRRVLFTDESRFLLRRADGRARVYRRRPEDITPATNHPRLSWRHMNTSNYWYLTLLMLIVLRNDEIYLFMCFSIYTDISLVINFGSNIDVNFLFWKSI